MSPPAAAPGASRQALAAGIGCYLLWSAMPVLFLVMGRAGASPWEILAQRVIWSLPCAAALVLAAGQTRQVLEVFSRPRVLGALALTAALITVNWAVYVWAVTNGRNLEASLGYFINPLLAMVAGAVVFREPLHVLGWVAIGLATIGVVVQAVALGHPPYISLALATAFCSYGVLRKQIDAEAQTGLFVECALLVLPGVALQWWLARHGPVMAGSSLGATLLLAVAGPMTVVPLALFSWAARRLPFSIIGFLQFIVPSVGFAVGVATGEPLTPMRALSFVFIWAGACAFLVGVWRASRALSKAAVQSAA